MIFKKGDLVVIVKLIQGCNIGDRGEIHCISGDRLFIKIIEQDRHAGFEHSDIELEEIYNSPLGNALR